VSKSKKLGVAEDLSAGSESSSFSFLYLILAALLAGAAVLYLQAFK
jgi:hypothetical protein